MFELIGNNQKTEKLQNHISSNRIPLLIKMFELIGNNQKTEKLQNVGKTV